MNKSMEHLKSVICRYKLCDLFYINNLNGMGTYSLNIERDSYNITYIDKGGPDVIFSTDNECDAINKYLSIIEDIYLEYFKDKE